MALFSTKSLQEVVNQFVGHVKKVVILQQAFAKPTLPTFLTKTL